MVAAPVFPSSPPPSSVNGTRPHIVAFLQDDLGWYDAFANLTDIQSAAVGSASANLQALAADGILLLRHYTHWHCSPSRRAFLTGRTPLHHGEQLSDATTHDIDLRWTTIGQKLDRAGYACHYYGKGHTGYMSMKHLPVFQGFSAGMAGFLHGAMGYTEPNRWSGDRPERNRKYSVRLYGDRALAAVAQHDPRTPLFMFLPWQAVHGPCAPATPNPHRRRPSARALFQIASVRAHLFRPPGRPTRFLYTRRPRIPRRPASVSQAPTRVIPRAPPRLLRPHAADEAPPGYNRSLTACAAWESEDRCVLYAMYRETDLYMGKVVDALRTKNMYDQTLILFASDNGGNNEGNNYPLRGAKRTNWEGGIRTPAFITGGLVPRELRGTASQVTLSIADWYPTFCNLAGIDPTDDPPVAPLAVDEAQDPSGPLLDIWGQESYPGVDGLDIWPILMNPQAHGHGSAHEVRGRLMVLHLVCISHPALPTDPRRHPSPARSLHQGGARHLRTFWQVLFISNEVIIHGGRYKLIVAQPSPEVLEGGPGGGDVFGWKQPNQSWIPDPVQKSCMRPWDPRVPASPCLYDVRADPDERVNLALQHPYKVEKLWRILNVSLLHRFHARSPPGLLGACNTNCSRAHWRSFGEGTVGPICGVPGCPAEAVPAAPSKLRATWGGLHLGKGHALQAR